MQAHGQRLLVPRLPRDPAFKKIPCFSITECPCGWSISGPTQAALRASRTCGTGQQGWGSCWHSWWSWNHGGRCAGGDSGCCWPGKHLPAPGQGCWWGWAGEGRAAGCGWVCSSWGPALRSPLAWEGSRKARARACRGSVCRAGGQLPARERLRGSG